MKLQYQSGHEAEEQAADYLRSKGFRIRELNWKTPRCEIDIVAEKGKRIYFVEVKYRRNAAHGTSLEYITPRKLKQMQFAAESWVQAKGWSGTYQLAAVGIDNEEIVLVTDI